MENKQTPTPENTAPKSESTIKLMSLDQIKQHSEHNAEQSSVPVPTVAASQTPAPQTPVVNKEDKKPIVIKKHGFFHQLKLFTSGVTMGVFLYSGFSNGILPTNKAELTLFFSSPEIEQPAEQLEGEEAHAAPVKEQGLLDKIIARTNRFLTVLPNSRNAQREEDINTIIMAVTEFAKTNRRFPEQITAIPQEICSASTQEECPGLILLQPELQSLLPTMPEDPKARGFQTRYTIHRCDDQIVVEAVNMEGSRKLNF